jgi:hypothetical protein
MERRGLPGSERPEAVLTAGAAHPHDGIGCGEGWGESRHSELTEADVVAAWEHTRVRSLCALMPLTARSSTRSLGTVTPQLRSWCVISSILFDEADPRHAWLSPLSPCSKPMSQVMPNRSFT